MRTVRVLTNETCDHRCSFCDVRREHERASVAGYAQVRARIEAARGAAEIVLTGGEPGLRRDLPRLVAAAAKTGANVVLESNGARLAPAHAELLARAGLGVVRLHVPGVELHAAITGDAAGWANLVALAHALHLVGVRVEAVVPIVAATLPELEQIAGRIRAALPMVATIRARVPSGPLNLKITFPDDVGLASRL
ncbi:MAG: radical SAM protein [Deltaproteobacteria bacterium]|nr:radical SAM protein [Nannocystaceae bacterium]